MSKRVKHYVSRRDVLKGMAGTVGVLSAGGTLWAQPADPETKTIQIDPAPLHELSPYLFMQFMEPLGATDSSVEAAWDHQDSSWRDDVMEATRDLGPTMMRWGGCFSSYYRWKEGVGPKDQRTPMYNLLWGGMETNRVGTAEFVEFCRQTGSDPLMCVNFESDGRRHWMKDYDGKSRFGDAEEAAEWVSYCNDPDNPLRKRHGYSRPLTIKMWQLGNETSYDKNGYDCETAGRKTVEFARAMRKADPDIVLIGWGDSGWAPRMLDAAGDHLQYIAFHHMFNPDNRRHPVLRGERYRRDPDATWDQLMQAWKLNDQKIRTIRESLGGRTFPLAMTECHFTLPGRDRCDVMSTWATGVAYARMFNNYQRHGDLLKIATAADFCGNRWQVNAIMIPTPRFKGKAYLMPVARVMKLYRHHIGRQAVKATSSEADLDVVASRTGNTIYLHIVNTNRIRPARVSVRMAGRDLRQGRIYQIAEDTTAELSYLNSDKIMRIKEKSLPADSRLDIPAASVSAVELPLS